MDNNIQRSNPYTNSIIALNECQLSFLENSTTASYTKQSLLLWLTNDMDRVFSFLTSKEEAHDFYDTIYQLISEFESEHANVESALQIAMNKSHMLLNVFYPDYLNMTNKYFESIGKLTQNALFVNGVPNMSMPPIANQIEFYDRYERICNDFLSSIKSYNSTVSELDKIRTKNHKKILNNGIIQRLLKDDKTTLRSITNSMVFHRLSILVKQ